MSWCVQTETFQNIALSTGHDESMPPTIVISQPSAIGHWSLLKPDP